MAVEVVRLRHAASFHLAVYDFGVKANILRSLADRGARLTVLPARTSRRSAWIWESTASYSPTDRATRSLCTEIIDNVRELADSDIPMFGICLGHQLLGLALGGSTFKLKFGHHGGNQPVKDLASGGCSSQVRIMVSPWIPTRLPSNCRCQSDQPERRDGRSIRVRTGRSLGAVPPRGGSGPARRLGPVRRVLDGDYEPHRAPK